MIKVVSVARMREIEAAANAAGISYATMMHNAGTATAERIVKLIGDRNDIRVTVLIGPGNNGGDGLVAGRLIAEKSTAQVRFYMLKQRADDDPNYLAAREAGLFFALAEDDQRYRVLQNMIATTDILLDALFGIGIKLPLRDNAAALLQTVNQVLAESGKPETDQIITVAPATPAHIERHRPYVMAVDCPSGLDCDTGEIDQNAIQADETITFIAAKPGLLRFPGAAHIGRLTVSTVGVPDDLPELKQEPFILVTSDDVRRRLPQRPQNAHKGTFGKVMIVAGSGDYIGAAGLAARAAYRVGAGLVTVATEKNIINTLASQQLETTWMSLDNTRPEEQAADIARRLDTYDALLIGPGWGQANQTRDLLHHLLGQDRLSQIPVVIDADGLSLLAEIDGWWRHLSEQTVITPHSGEMARLCRLDVATVQESREELACERAAEWGFTVILKGAHSIIAVPDGRMAALPFKTDSLAKAGTGDVLAGMLVGLVGQGMPSFDAALTAAYLHGLAGIEAARQLKSSRSVLAGDVVENISRALAAVTGQEAI